MNPCPECGGTFKSPCMLKLWIYYDGKQVVAKKTNYSHDEEVNAGGFSFDLGACKAELIRSA